MSRTLRPLAAFAMVALISVISAGCGSNASSESRTASSTRAASSTSSTGTTTSGANKKLSARDKAVKFAECIRAHGVSDFRRALRPHLEAVGIGRPDVHEHLRIDQLGWA
jgi:hypothetical protein